MIPIAGHSQHKQTAHTAGSSAAPFSLYFLLLFYIRPRSAFDMQNRWFYQSRREKVGANVLLREATTFFFYYSPFSFETFSSFYSRGP